MAEAKSDSDWNHTASVLALLANVNRDPRKHRPFRVEDFKPRPAGRRVRHREIPLSRLVDDMMAPIEKGKHK